SKVEPLSSQRQTIPTAQTEKLKFLLLQSFNLHYTHFPRESFLTGRSSPRPRRRKTGRPQKGKPPNEQLKEGGKQIIKKKNPNFNFNSSQKQPTFVMGRRDSSTHNNAYGIDVAEDRGGGSHRRRNNDFKPFKQWFPWLVPLFVVANVVMFVIVMYVNDCPKRSLNCIGTEYLGRFAFQPLKQNPLLGPSPDALMEMGAMDVKKVVKGHQPWRLISCIWLHAGVFHLVANMHFAVRIGLVYLLSGFGGSVMSALFLQDGISVGASGALFGLLGAMLSELITNWTIYANKFAALLTLVIIVVLNLAVGILPHVDNYAHIGGFVSGFLLGFVFLIRPQFGWVSQKTCPPGYIAPPVKSKYKAYQYFLLALALILLMSGFAIALVDLYREVDVTKNCSWCEYLTCIPTPLWSCNAPKVYCESSQFGLQLNLTCSSNGKSGIYVLPDDNPAHAQVLCSELCQ
ncbi:RHOMBOID-like protein 1, partial [Linum perenne]